VSERESKITARLRECLQPTELELINESHLHVGHVGAQTGLGHFRLIIASKHFENRSMLERHRLIYDALGDLMQTDIHALTVIARTPTKPLTQPAP